MLSCFLKHEQFTCISVQDDIEKYHADGTMIIILTQTTIKCFTQMHLDISISKMQWVRVVTVFDRLFEDFFRIV